MTQPRAPSGLGRRGRRLWREMNGSAQLGPGQLVLLAEACRIVDRLDRLDGILRGDSRELAAVTEDRDGELRLVVDSVLTEARQQAAALKQIMAELRQGGSRQKSKVDLTGSRGSQGVADLTSRIAARRESSQG